MTTNETTTTPTPWPTSDQVINALGTMQDRDDLHANWTSVLGRLRQDAERHTALRAARELLERERQALAGETGTDPIDARPSGALAVFDAIAKVGELETMALCRYACCAQAALELVAAGGTPASWSEPLPGERPRLDGDEQPLLPEPEEGPRRPARARGPDGRAWRRPAPRGAAAVRRPGGRPPGVGGRLRLQRVLRRAGERLPRRPAHPRAHDRRGQRDRAGDDRAPEYLADYADAAAWTLTHGLRDRLRATADAQGPRGGDS